MNISRLMFLVSLLLATAVVEAASVKSVSREQYRQDSPEEIYWQVNVTCSGIDEKRIIQQRADTDGWCAKDVEELCARSKMKAAERICGSAYKRATPIIKESQPETVTTKPASTINPEDQAAAEQKPFEPRVTITPPLVSRDTTLNPTVDNTLLPVEGSSTGERSEQTIFLSNEIEIEEQRIAIEQEKLDLRRRELALKKRELELLNNADN